LDALYSSRKGVSPHRIALPPPVHGASSFSRSKPSHASSFQKGSQSYYDQNAPASTPARAAPYYDQTSAPSMAPPPPSSTYDNQVHFSLFGALRNIIFYIYLMQLFNNFVGMPHLPY